MRAILQIFLVLGTLTFTLWAQEKPRKRLAYRGHLFPNAHAPAKWSPRAGSVVQDAIKGDLFIVETNVRAHESQAIAIYAWAQYLKEGKDCWEFDGDPFRITVSEIGKEWGYESNSFPSSCGAFTMTTNTSGQSEVQRVQLFLPNAVMILPAKRNLQIKYEVAVTIGNDFVDRFFIDKTFNRILSAPISFREKIRVSKEDENFEFKLVGAQGDQPGV